MRKVLGSWSGMRKYLEQDMLAEPLRGRVRYNCTTYVGMDGCRIFEVFIDGHLAKQFSWETVNSYFIRQRCADPEQSAPPVGLSEYWADFLQTLDRSPMNTRTEYTDGEFCSALKAYRERPVRESLYSYDPIRKMFALLDRRVGKRTLAAIEEDMKSQPSWLQTFYRLRVGTV